MILLIGGTSESSALALALNGAGHSVLVSMATDVPLALPLGSGIELRRGRLNLEAMVALIKERQIKAVVDAAHPFAREAHATVAEAARVAALPYLHWMRDASDLPADQHVAMVRNHEEAARLAAAWGKAILLTTGSRNLQPYLREATLHKLPLYARVLPGTESEQACRDAGFPFAQITFARGPFSVDDTLTLLRKLEIGTLISKESGKTGGVPEKIEAAQRAGCRVILIERAQYDEATLCRSHDEVIKRLALALSTHPAE